MEEDNYDFSEISGVAPEMSPEFKTHSERATPEEIIAIAKRLWACVRESGISKDDEKGNDALMEDLRDRDEFRNFATSFPVVARWIVQARKFNVNALKAYLRKHASADLKSREAFLDLQAEYLVLIYKEEHVHADARKVKIYRDGIIKTLRQEDKVFMEVSKQVDDDLEAQKKLRDAEYRADILRWIKERRDMQTATRIAEST